MLRANVLMIALFHVLFYFVFYSKVVELLLLKFLTYSYVCFCLYSSVGNYWPDKDQCLLEVSQYHKVFFSISELVVFSEILHQVIYYLDFPLYMLLNEVSISKFWRFYTAFFLIAVALLNNGLKFFRIFPYAKISHRLSFMHSKRSIFLFKLVYLFLSINGVFYITKNYFLGSKQYLLVGSIIVDIFKLTLNFPTLKIFMLRSKMFLGALAPPFSLLDLRTVYLFITPLICLNYGIWMHYFIDCMGYFYPELGYSVRKFDFFMAPFYAVYSILGYLCWVTLGILLFVS